jgi:D-glycero-alpha-D-manno-heptose-7-phosphate kinase
VAARARAWCRADLAGGTLDIWPLGLLHAGACTVNVALDLAVTVEVERRRSGYRVSQEGSVVAAASPAELAAHPEAALAGVVAAALDLPPFEVRLASESPRGGGLGASSALTVALLAAAEAELDLPRSPPERLARLARDLEARLMELPTGCQDHYPALLGGALEIGAAPGGERVRRLAADLGTLGESLLVVYSGQSHFSAGNNWQVIRRRLDGEAEVAALFAGIARVAAAAGPALEAGNLRRLGELLSEEWSYRRQLAPGVSTPVLEELLALAAAGGAWGGKACGAGGGGCLVLLCPPGKRARIARGLESAGGQVLATRPTGEPMDIGRSG